MVRSIRVRLRLQAEPAPLHIRNPALAHQSPIQKITGVKLHRRLRGCDRQHAPALRRKHLRRLAQRSRRSTHHKVMVVPTPKRQLLVLLLDTGTDHRRLPEVKRRSLYRHNLSCRNRTRARHRRVRVRLQQQLLIQNRSARLTRQVEVRVVGQIHHRQLVRRRRIRNPHRIPLQRIRHARRQNPRKSLVAISAHQRKLHPARDLFRDPVMSVKSHQAAVQHVHAIIDRRLYSLSAQIEPTQRNPIGEPSRHRPKVRILVVHIRIQRCISERHIAHLTRAVRGPQRHHASTIPNHSQLDRLTLQRIHIHNAAISHRSEQACTHRHTRNLICHSLQHKPARPPQHALHPFTPPQTLSRGILITAAPISFATKTRGVICQEINGYVFWV